MKFCIVIYLVMTAIGICAAETAVQFQAREPIDVYVKLNGSVTMECIMFQGESQCVWLIHGVIKLPDENHVYNTKPLDGNCSLLINSVTLNDDGPYQCQYSTADGNTVSSNMAKLTVLYAPEPPVINYRGQDILEKEVKIFLPNTEDVNFNISCNSSFGNPAPILRWFTDNYEPQGHVEYIGKEGTPLQATINTLDLTSKEAIAMKVVHCSSEHPAWDGGKQITVNFLTGSPTATVTAVFAETNETTCTAPSGSSVTVMCTADGEPVPSFRWEMLEGDQPNNAWSHVHYGANVSLKTPSGVTAYRCNAQNEFSNGVYVNSEKIILKSSVSGLSGGKFGTIFSIAVLIALIHSW